MTRLLRLATSGLGVLLAAGMGAPVLLLVVSSAPTVAYAKECTRNTEGICKFNNIERCGKKNEGTCKTRTYGCECVTPTDEAHEHYINVMYDSVRAALPFPQVVTNLGLPEACDQLDLLLTNLFTAKSLLVELGPLGFGTAKLIEKIEYIILHLPILASFGSSCTPTIGIPSSTSSTMLGKKQEAKSHLFDALSTSP